MSALTRFFTTISYVTCFPLSTIPESDEKLSGLAKYLPAAGLVIALFLLAEAFCLELLPISSLLASAILVLSWLAFSGGLHFDGLMDTADGIFSHRDVSRMLEIMTDSRVGNFGVMTGLSVILLKVASLSSLPHQLLLVCLALIPSWARFCQVFAIGFFPYAKAQGMGKVWHDSTRLPGDLLLCAILPVAASGACAYYFGLRPVLVVSLFTIVSGAAASFYLASILKGHTGDTYGAVVELSEVAALLLCALFSAAIF